MEKNKLEEILVEVEERRERVIWINDGLKHIDMLDPGCLLHHLPQFFKKIRRGLPRGDVVVHNLDLCLTPGIG